MITIDTHTHVNFNAFKKDGDEIIKKSLQENVWMINVGSENKTSQRAIDYAQKYKEGVYAAVGLHPIHLFSIESLEDENNVEKFNYQKYLKFTQQNKVVAIGEVGLDYHHFEENHDIKSIKKLQKEVFKEFLKLSQQTKKPLIIHCWDAYDDLLEILNDFFKNNKIDYEIGVIHSFIGSWKTAQKFLDLRFKIGINGIATYSESYDKLIRNCPLKDLLIETDAPYLTPKPLPRDSRNEPINVKLIAKKIAEVKNIKIEKVIEQTTKNAKSVFKI
ncbi:MAG: TatD family hydrolase [Candidatus Moranbacteria bacterium]|nr:TatD family hydrolase [Candidatus Moranbacteria bacterium]